MDAIAATADWGAFLRRGSIAAAGAFFPLFRIRAGTVRRMGAARNA
jgi:hypothetical protein